MTTSPLLVGAHGWLLSSKVWSPLQRLWDPPTSRWRLWCPDLPGFGDEPCPPGLRPTLAAYGQWLAERALAEAAGAPLVLMGHSLGASVVLHAAHYLQAQAADQLKGVVCIAAGGGIYQPRPFQRLRLGGRLAIQLRPQLPIPLGPFQAEERAALGLLVNSTCRGAIRQIPHLVADLEVANLWISGSNDQVMEPCYVKHLAGYSRQHELVFINNCGHLPMHTHAEHLQQHLQAWLKEER